MIRLSVCVDGVTLTLADGDQVTVDADQAQNLGNELLNCAIAARIAAARAAHPSNYRTTLTTETPR
jgi:hypothetical protein